MLTDENTAAVCTGPNTGAGEGSALLKVHGLLPSLSWFRLPADWLALKGFGGTLGCVSSGGL